MGADCPSLARNLPVVQAHAFFGGLGGILAPVLVYFQTDAVGLSLTQVMVGQATLAASAVVLEVPSGILADRAGRKPTLTVASVAMVLYLALLSSASGFPAVLVAMTLAGLSVAFASGAQSALLYDTLRQLGREDEHMELRGRLHTIYFGTGFAVTLVGGLVAELYGSRFVAQVCAATQLLSLGCVFIMREPSRFDEECSSTGGSPLVHLVAAARLVATTPLLRYCGLWVALSATAGVLSYRVLNPLWELRGVSLSHFGLAFSAYTGVSALVGAITPRVLGALGTRATLGTSLLLFGATYIALGLLEGRWLALCVPALFAAAMPLSSITASDLVNRAIESHHRATILSLNSLLGQLLVAVALPAVGLLSRGAGLPAALVVVGLSTLALGLPAWLGIARHASHGRRLSIKSTASQATRGIH